jgi:hypothetical protein
MQKSMEPRGNLRAPVSFINRIRDGAKKRKMNMTAFMEDAGVVYLVSEVTTQ